MFHYKFQKGKSCRCAKLSLTPHTACLQFAVKDCAQTGQQRSGLSVVAVLAPLGG